MSSSTASKKHPRDAIEDFQPPAAKRPHKEEGNSSVSVPLDALSLIMEFLSARQLFNMAFTCKTLRDFVTTEMVVRSALVGRGRAKETMKAVGNIMSAKAIHVPSPLRLLRLTNGKRCEFCFLRKVPSVHPRLGVFACRVCVTTRDYLTRPWSWKKNIHKYIEYKPVVDDPRVVILRGGSIWLNPSTDDSGEQIGPLITFGDIDKLRVHVTRGGSIDSYLINHLCVPSDEDGYKLFIGTFSKAKQQAARVEKFRETEAWGKRKAKVDKFIEDLTPLLDEPFRLMALKHDKQSSKELSKMYSLDFRIPFITELMRPFIRYPSKICKKALQELAERINGNFRLVEEKGFLTKFLSTSEPSDTPLRWYFIDELTSLEALFDDAEHTKFVTAKFFSLLANDQLVAALAHLMNPDFSGLWLEHKRITPSEKVGAEAL